MYMCVYISLSIYIYIYNYLYYLIYIILDYLILSYLIYLIYLSIYLSLSLSISLSLYIYIYIYQGLQLPLLPGPELEAGHQRLPRLRGHPQLRHGLHLDGPRRADRPGDAVRGRAAEERVRRLRGVDAAQLAGRERPGIRQRGPEEVADGPLQA